MRSIAGSAMLLLCLQANASGQGISSAEYAAFLKEENVKWGNMVKALNLRAE